MRRDRQRDPDRGSPVQRWLQYRSRFYYPTLEIVRECLHLSLTVPRYMNHKACHINTLQEVIHVSRLPSLPVSVRGIVSYHFRMNRFHLFPCTHQLSKSGYMQARHTREALKAWLDVRVQAIIDGKTPNADAHPRLLLAEERRAGRELSPHRPGLRVLPQFPSVQPVGQHGLQRRRKAGADPRRCERPIVVRADDDA